MQGWVKIYRSLLDDPLWKNSTSNQRSVLIAILLLANHKSNEWEWQGKKFVVSPGQFITSLPKLATKSGKGITVQMVRGSLVRLSKLGFLTDQATEDGRLITVGNWVKYQDEKISTTDQPTEGQQTDNRPTTPNKNVKNEKNEKNVVVGDTNNPVNLWTDLWGFPNAIAQQDLTEWRNQFGDELVNYAINYAARRNVQSYGADKYLFKVFDGWSDLKITTVEQAKKEAEKHEQQQSNRRGGFIKNQIREKESLPDWAENQPTETKPMDPDAQAKLQKRLEALRRKDGGRTDEN